MKNNIKALLLEQVESIFANYGLIIGFMIISFIGGYLFKEFVSDRHYRKQINLRLQDKDERINDLKQIIQERAKKIVVDKTDASLFGLWKKIVKYFNRS